jgi:diguanylate cyclase (GGDEF)-like protein
VSPVENHSAPSRRDEGGQRPARVESGVERPLTWNPDLVEALQGLLLSGRTNGRDLDREIAPLLSQYREAVYSELIYLLCHIRFEPVEASLHWHNIVELSRSMQRRLGSPVDLRVALVSYFLESDRGLENPTVIEMRLFEQAREMAYRDELTGLHNFRYFQEFLNYEISRSRQYHSGVSLVMIDIDDFKTYNDNLGHQAGNEALAEIARLINGSLREVDLAARYGGEEFVVVAPETPKLGARLLAKRIRERIERHAFPGEEKQPGGRLTASLGVATYPADAADVEGLVRRADQALYLGKSTGKNQVCLYGNNRRSYRRVPAEIQGTVSYGTEEANLTTMDLSEGGVRFLTELSLPLDALVELRLQLPEPGNEIRIGGRVIQSSAREAGGCEAAVRAIEIGARDRKWLAAALEEIAGRA